MILKLSDLLRANVESDKYSIEFYNYSNYKPLIFGIYPGNDCDVLKYPCEACGPTLIILHVSDSGITGCIDDNFKPIGYPEYPQICRDCEQKARQRLGLKGENE